MLGAGEFRRPAAAPVFAPHMTGAAEALQLLGIVFAGESIGSQVVDIELPAVFLGGLSTLAAVLVAPANSFLYLFPAGAVTEHAAAAPTGVGGSAKHRWLDDLPGALSTTEPLASARASYGDKHGLLAGGADHRDDASLLSPLVVATFTAECSLSPSQRFPADLADHEERVSRPSDNYFMRDPNALRPERDLNPRFSP